ncbi:hypothetical protein [Nocardia ignorata]|uniref:Prenyltransferase/squalene oxidase-like repeat protein n=1 Tax=Nocardia ignorata TaxID=145285 RepID=A0A4R6P735_NOCIG|nr:hypothetical protein [Nocardia ignorata]TDP31829.1 hypothetical protein DFR75_10754 [Nocardia ignorata]
MSTIGRARGPIVTRLLHSEEPSIRWRTLLGVLGVPPLDPAVATAAAAVPGSERVRRLLSERLADGTLPFHPYNAKWRGAHWVLVSLAELGYPAGDDSLVPLREQALGWLLSPEYERRYIGRVRNQELPTLHASIEGNLVWALPRLGLADERVDRLAARLLHAQWPDGGWNCDRRATGRVSSFGESLVPLRALNAYARTTGDPEAREAVLRASELFLGRRLFRRRTDGSVIDRSFLELHFPCYWHYDILFALTVLAESGAIADPRCAEALDVLEAKRLPDGGFPAEAKFYRVSSAHPGGGSSVVGWGPTSRRTSNEWVSCSALIALTAAGRRGPSS